MAATGLLNTSSYTLGGALPADAVTIGLYKENSDGKAMSLKDGKPSASSNKLNGLAAQQVEAQVQKAVKPVYEIGSYNYYIIDGRPQGQGTIAYLFGPSGKVIDGIKTFANVCTPCTLRVAYNSDGTGCNVAGNDKMDFKSGTLTSFSVQATAADFMVTGSIGFIFMDVRG